MLNEKDEKVRAVVVKKPIRKKFFSFLHHCVGVLDEDFEPAIVDEKLSSEGNQVWIPGPFTSDGISKTMVAAHCLGPHLMSRQ